MYIICLDVLPSSLSLCVYIYIFFIIDLKRLQRMKISTAYHHTRAMVVVYKCNLIALISGESNGKGERSERGCLRYRI